MKVDITHKQYAEMLNAARACVAYYARELDDCMYSDLFRASQEDLLDKARDHLRWVEDLFDRPTQLDDGVVSKSMTCSCSHDGTCDCKINE